MPPHDYDIKVWHSPAQPTVDICFVHGLKGHRDKTWTVDGTNQQPWPATMLPGKFPHAHLLTFGYDADVVRLGVASKDTIKSLAESLLYSLKRVRQEVDALHRPIIFVVHSLGGIVCKKAIALSQQRSADETLGSLATSLIGVVFMGTPHNGSSFADAAGLLVSSFRWFKSTNKNLLKALAKDNQMATDIDNEFWDACNVVGKDPKPKVQVFCFYEVLPLPAIKKCVVPEKSAVYQHQPYMKIHANHHNLVKFESTETTGFKDLCGVLRDFLSSGRATLLLSSGAGSPSPPHSPQPPAPQGGGLRSDPTPPGPQGSGPLPSSSANQGSGTPIQRCHLPFQKNRNFVGREDVLSDLRTLLFDEAYRAVALCGLGGVGKTQVANELAHWTKENNPDHSVFWVPALSKSGFEEAYEAIATKLGIQRTANEDVKIIVRDYLSSDDAGNWLLVVDNADDPDLICGRDVPDCLDQYLPQSANGRVLVTTRTMVVSQAVAEKIVSLYEFGPSQAKALATKLLQRKQPNSQDDDASLDELLQELVYLPLAITQAMAFLSHTGLSAKAYLALLRRTETDRLDLLGKESPDRTRYKESRHAIATTWLVSFDHLQKSSPDAVALLGFLSQIQPKAIPLSLLPKVGSSSAGLHAVKELCEYSFMSIHDDVMLDMHSLVHMAARSWFLKNNRIEETAHTALQHVVGIFPNDKYENRDTWRVFLPHVLYMLRDGKAVHSYNAWKLCRRAGRCLYEDGRIKEAMRCYEYCTQWTCQSFPEDHPSRLGSQHSLASAYHANGQIQKAVDLLEHVVKVREKLAEDHPSRLGSQHELAAAYRANGQIQKAINILEHVVKFKKKLAEDHRNLLASQHVLALAYRANGQIQKAVDLLEHVVKVREKLAEDHPSRLGSQHELAVAYRANGQIQKAVDLLEHVVKVGEKLAEDNPYRLAAQYSLAVAYRANGQSQKAVDLLEHFVKVQEKLAEDHPDRLGWQHELAAAYRANGQSQKAVDLFEPMRQ
ncbi:kinesin light chain 1 [Ophiostoma piceae UAMH 11346]|uniref:Kinesin light chain 1 n=1 Tax=Ophiostoma piceae (strain UAMH 11346) TaxID=1262450 RepID=S3C5V1_OPHP1|nr:kinesin light chain 1 [Ophiostoma piceae UAMH 11346]